MTSPIPASGKMRRISDTISSQSSVPPALTEILKSDCRLNTLWDRPMQFFTVHEQIHPTTTLASARGDYLQLSRQCETRQRTDWTGSGKEQNTLKCNHGTNPEVVAGQPGLYCHTSAGSLSAVTFYSPTLVELTLSEAVGPKRPAPGTATFSASPGWLRDPPGDWLFPLSKSTADEPSQARLTASRCHDVLDWVRLQHGLRQIVSQ
ncbi:hypothetical protein BJY00DRAFT_160020 [Aspergillus carlsbadensis]|nr:hypothetical protein BJY00DRAFT_160020 [Aspergillus carlsbadensis]